MKAAFLGNARAMDLLIDYGANVNEIDAIGYTVLMRSVLSKCAECVRILVEAGAVVNYVQKTPMMDLGLSAQKLAMLMGEREIAEILRNAGADELETGAEKKRRLQKEGAERFKEHVEAQGIDVDIDKLLNTTVDDLNVKNSQSGDVVVNVNGTNATMTHDETKDYRNLEEKIAQAKLKAEAAARAKEACASDAGDGSCAFDPTTKDEL
jgi:ankyrin repeat protein